MSCILTGGRMLKGCRVIEKNRVNLGDFVELFRVLARQTSTVWWVTRHSKRTISFSLQNGPGSVPAIFRLFLTGFPPATHF